MKRLIQLTIMFLLTDQTVAPAVAAERVPRKGKPLQIPFSIMPGGVLATFHLEQVNEVDPSALPIPQLYYVHYEWDGTHLQIRLAQRGNRDSPQELYAMDGWYVTADYSTNPPHASLTKEPTKDSRWQFVPTRRRARYYIRNDNDRGTELWLNLTDTGKLYLKVDQGLSDARGVRPYRYWKGRVFNAILSPDKKEFVVNDIELDGGK